MGRLVIQLASLAACILMAGGIGFCHAALEWALKYQRPAPHGARILSWALIGTLVMLMYRPVSGLLGIGGSNPDMPAIVIGCFLLLGAATEVASLCRASSSPAPTLSHPLPSPSHPLPRLSYPLPDLSPSTAPPEVKQPASGRARQPFLLD